MAKVKALGERAYTVRIHTGDCRDAGTSASVLLSLRGERGSSGVCEVKPPTPWAWSRGEVAEFAFDAGGAAGGGGGAGLGELVGVRVGHDNGTLDARWFVQRVEVAHEASGRQWTFPCGKWICGGRLSSGYSYVDLEPAVAGEDEAREDAGRRDLETCSSGKRMKVEAGEAARPHPKKQRLAGGRGEDACFVRSPLHSLVEDGTGLAYLGDEGKHHIVGIADGVGEWSQRGVDPSLFSRNLMRRCRDLCQAWFMDSQLSGLNGAAELLDDDEDLRGLMGAAYRELQADGYAGSCTVCLLHVNADKGFLSSANLGDSGYLVVRDGRVCYRTAQQEHIFGCPYQLSSAAGGDSPADAVVHRMPVRPGDVIVAATDGLFDNLDDDDVAARATAHFAAGMSAADVARALADAAHEVSLDKLADTPYSRSAREEFGMVYSGGKMDDCTVVVLKIG